MKARPVLLFLVLAAATGFAIGVRLGWDELKARAALATRSRVAR